MGLPIPSSFDLYKKRTITCQWHNPVTIKMVSNPYQHTEYVYIVISAIHAVGEISGEFTIKKTSGYPQVKSGTLCSVQPTFWPACSACHPVNYVARDGRRVTVFLLVWTVFGCP